MKHKFSRAANHVMAESVSKKTKGRIITDMRCQIKLTKPVEKLDKLLAKADSSMIAGLVTLKISIFELAGSFLELMDSETTAEVPFNRI